MRSVPRASCGRSSRMAPPSRVVRRHRATVATLAIVTSMALAVATVAPPASGVPVGPSSVPSTVCGQDRPASEGAAAERDDVPPGAIGYDGPLLELIAAYEDAVDEFWSPLYAAQTDEEWERIDHELLAGEQPHGAFLPRFRALADEAAGTDLGTRALVWTFRVAAQDMVHLGDAARSVVDELLADPLDSPALEEFAEVLENESHVLGRERTKEVLRALAERATLATVRAAALFYRCYLDYGNDPGEPAEQARLAGRFREIVERYPETRYGKASIRYAYELEHLQVGMQAPDFEAVDVDGVAFRLSDYRGRVVLLHFWGFWSEACMEQLPELRALVERLSDDRFVVLGVNSDESRKGLKDRLVQAGISWRNAIEGTTQGPIRTAWNVQHQPKSFLLDADGVIRSRDPRVEKLESAIRALLEAMETER